MEQEMNAIRNLITSVVDFTRPFLPIWLKSHPYFLQIYFLFFFLIASFLFILLYYCLFEGDSPQPERIQRKLSEPNGLTINTTNSPVVSDVEPISTQSNLPAVTSVSIETETTFRTIIECFVTNHPSIINQCIQTWIPSINETFPQSTGLEILVDQEYVTDPVQLREIKFPEDSNCCNLSVLADIGLNKLQFTCKLDETESLKILLKNFEGWVKFTLILKSDSIDFETKLSEVPSYEFSTASDTFIETNRIDQLRDSFRSSLNCSVVRGQFSLKQQWFSSLIQQAHLTLLSTSDDSQRHSLLLCLISAILPSLQTTNQTTRIDSSSQSESDVSIENGGDKSTGGSNFIARSNSLPNKSNLRNSSKLSRSARRTYPRFTHDPIKEEIIREETQQENLTSLESSLSNYSSNLTEVDPVYSEPNRTSINKSDTKLYESFWRSISPMDSETQPDEIMGAESNQLSRSQLADTSSSSATTNEDGEVIGAPLVDEGFNASSDPITPSNFDPSWITSVPRRTSATGTISGSDFDDEGSPFHGRAHRAKKLLIKVISASDLVKKDSYCRNAFCVVEVNEPYQRHVTHLASKTSNPYWDQHYLFEINQNSRKILLEVFDKSKQKKVLSLGQCVLYLSSLTGDSSMRLSLPLNTTRSSSAIPLRPSDRWDGMDAPQPLLVIEIQFMEPSEHVVASLPPSQLLSKSISDSQSVTTAAQSNSIKLDLPEETTQSKYFFPNSELEPVPEIMVTRSTPEPEYENKYFLPPLNETVDVHCPADMLQRSGSLSAPSPKRSRSFVSRLRKTLPLPRLKKKSLSDENLGHRSASDKKREEFDPAYPTEQVVHLTSTSNLSKMKTLSSSLRKIFLPKKSKDSFPALQNPIFRLEQSLDTDSFDAISNEGFLKIAHDS